MTRIFTLVLLVGALGLAWGCQHNRVQVSNQNIGEQKDQRLEFYWWGLSPEHMKFNAKELCGDKGLRDVYERLEFQEGLYTVLTLGIYAPRRVTFTCNAGVQTSLIERSLTAFVSAFRPAEVR